MKCYVEKTLINDLKEKITFDNYFNRSRLVVETHINNFNLIMNGIYLSSNDWY